MRLVKYVVVIGLSDALVWRFSPPSVRVLTTVLWAAFCAGMAWVTWVTKYESAPALGAEFEDDYDGVVFPEPRFVGRS